MVHLCAIAGKPLREKGKSLHENRKSWHDKRFALARIGADCRFSPSPAGMVKILTSEFTIDSKSRDSILDTIKGAAPMRSDVNS